MRPTPLLLAALATPLAHAAGDIAVTVTPDNPTLGKRDNVMVTVTLANTGSAPVRLPKWRTPFAPVEHPLFEITRDGVPVRYLGREVKRAAPTAADFVALGPGERRSARLELSSLYEMSTTGAYAVRYREAALLPGGAGPSTLRSNSAAIWIEGRHARGVAAPAMSPPSSAGLSYEQCSNSQQESIAEAMRTGSAMAANGLAYLAAGQAPGARYLHWFGAPDAGRQARVAKNFTAILDAFENKPVKVDCGCDEDYFAYVYPARPYTIHVCKAFWTAPMTGTDSMGGTLLHELSHFDIVAGTDDHVYGQAGAAEMARTAPGRAVNNADSHEYFGENTPPLD